VIKNKAFLIHQAGIDFAPPRQCSKACISFEINELHQKQSESSEF